MYCGTHRNCRTSDEVMRQKWNKHVKIQGEVVEKILIDEDDADDDGSDE